jgi:hypothetical protein
MADDIPTQSNELLDPLEERSIGSFATTELELASSAGR